MPLFGANRILVPKLTWGVGGVNTLVFPSPIEGANAYSIPREGGPRVDSHQEGWEQPAAGHNRFLSGEIVIPPTDYTTTWAPATGWEGPTGWEAFLATWAQGKRAFTFYPNRLGATTYTMKLWEPMKGGVTADFYGWRRLKFVFRTTDDTRVMGY